MAMATPRPSKRGKQVSVEIPPHPDSSEEPSPAFSSPFSVYQPTPGPRADFPSPGARHHYQGGGGTKGRDGYVLGLKHQNPQSFRNTILVFGLLQIFVVWLVVTAMVYVQDYALRGPQAGEVAKEEASLLHRLGLGLQQDCALRPPVCRPEGVMEPDVVHDMQHSSTDPSNLPLVFFFAGIEGSGHKFFEQIFRRLPVNFSIVTFEPGLHLTAHAQQTNVHPRNSSRFAECPRLPYARPLKEYAHEMAQRLKAAGPGPYVRARDSYPLGRVRTPLARPDLVSLLQLDGHLFRLKVLVLLRDLAGCVRSAARMGYHGGDTGLQARIVEDSMVFLDASIRMLPCHRYMVLDFDWVAEEPQVAASALAEFVGLNVTAEDVVGAVHGARSTRPVHNATLPQFGTALSLEEFFALRADMWPLLSASRATPFFWPKAPEDWPLQSSVRNASGLSTYDYF